MTISQPSPKATVLLTCRAGFESAARDEAHVLLGSFLSRVKPGLDSACGFLTAEPAVSQEELAPHVSRVLRRQMKGADESGFSPACGPVFLHDVILGYEVDFPKGTHDRLGPLKLAVQECVSEGEGPLPSQVLSELGQIHVRGADPAAGVPGLDRFVKKFQTVLLQHFGTKDQGNYELIVIFLNYERAVVALRERVDAEVLQLRGRVPRLQNAPSRSGSKLTEALRFFQVEAPQGSAWAVDLGAAPGGWSAVLVEAGYQVMAVDNGALSLELLETGRVRHFTEDAFRFQPQRPVDLMVCDVVDKPQKTINLVSKWVEKGYAKHFVFNLKLPMKKHYSEVSQCLTALRTAIESLGWSAEIDAHHLYHDRQEVTVWVKLRGRIS